LHADRRLRNRDTRERLRREFGYRCGYCCIAESSLCHGTPRWIEVYHPAHTHLELEDSRDYLVYVCPFCSRARQVTHSDHAKLLNRRMPAYRQSFRLEDNGTLTPLTSSAEYTANVMDLNDPRKVELRRQESEMRQHREELLPQLLAGIDGLEALDKPDAGNTLNVLRMLVRTLQGIYAQLPEPIDLDGEEPDIHVLDCLELEKQLTPWIVSHLQKSPNDIRRLDPHVFEQLIAEFFASWGYDVKLLGRDPMTGADIMALKSESPPGVEIRYLIEVKRHRDRIGIQEIHRILGVLSLEKPLHGWDVAFLFSASGFKDFRKASAEDLRRFGLVLKDDTDIADYLRSYTPRTDGGLWLPQDWEPGLWTPSRMRVRSPTSDSEGTSQAFKTNRR